jgi:S-adenosyl-L-methionine hydrolase (adenosine-forming)
MITLISDLGTKNVNLAVAKGFLYRAVPNVRLLDVTHRIGEGNLIQAAYALEGANRNFPPGSVHLVLIDFFNIRCPRILVCRHNGQYFIGADNGLFTLTFGSDLEHVWGFPVIKGATFAENMVEVALLAAYCKQLAGGMPRDDWKARKVEPIIRRGVFQPANSKSVVECAVLDIDNYENVVLDLQRHQFESIIGDKPFRIHLAGPDYISTVSNAYADVDEGKPLCKFNSAGFLTLALNRGNIAGRLNMKGLSPDELIYRRIRIQM